MIFCTIAEGGIDGEEKPPLPVLNLPMEPITPPVLGFPFGGRLSVETCAWASVLSA
jgi:hypothetical protein